VQGAVTAIARNEPEWRLEQHGPQVVNASYDPVKPAVFHREQAIMESRMDRRAFVAGLISAAALSRLQVDAVGAQTDPTRTIQASAEDRLLELLALIPHSDRFRGLLDSEMRWVDVAKQIDAFGRSKNPDDVSGSVLYQGYWPKDPEFLLFSSGEELLHLDQALSIEHRDQSESLSIFMGADSEALAQKLRELGYEEVQFNDVTVLIHREPDLRNQIQGRNRFVAVLGSYDTAVYASSEAAILEYAGLIASHGSTMDEVDLGSQLEMLREDAWSQSWLPGRVLDKSNVEFSETTDPELVERRELVRGLEHLEQRRFGIAPEVLKVAVGIDAGLPTRNLRNPEASPIPVVDGYDDQPSEYVFLQYASEEDARRASEIIDWRWENAISWRTGEPLSDLVSPEPIDQSQIETGLILQTFADRFATHFVANMIIQGDLALYGWGTW
jgi:hypothetical protein